jgi:hypothetical protein
MPAKSVQDRLRQARHGSKLTPSNDLFDSKKVYKRDKEEGGIELSDKSQALVSKHLVEDGSIQVELECNYL